MDIGKKIREAEGYDAMGMYNESLMVFRQILSKDLPLDDDLSTKLKQKVELLEKKIYQHNANPSIELSDAEISLIKKTFADGRNVGEILQRAEAFKELGLYVEAGAAFEAALNADGVESSRSPVDILLNLFYCLLAIRSSEETVEYIRQLIKKNALPDNDKVVALSAMADALAADNRAHLAEIVIGDVLASHPQNKAAKDRLKAYKAKQIPNSKFSLLLDKAIIDTDQLQKALAKAKSTKRSVETVLIQDFGVKKKDMGCSLSAFFDCPFRSYDPDLPVPVELTGKLKKAFLIHHAWVPLTWSRDGVEILVDDPKDLRKTDHIKALMATGKIRFCVGLREDIILYIERFFAVKEEKPLESSLDDLESIVPDVAFEEEEEPEEDEEVIDESSSQVVRFVDQVLISAHRTGVSDIHIEPSPISKMTTIRFRMDGVCQEYVQVPNIMAPGFLSRLKIMSGLDIAERRLPQDGKIKIKRKGIPTFELRLSTMPTAGGNEDAVLRILAKAGAMKLDEMGLNQRNLTILQKIIVQPYGLILVVGPTGSGKTTTLHAALGHINKPEIKIWTAEDPVEITQPGLRQVEAKPRIGLDFARIMRGFLRLDPDVIMIGEMRDEETASIGVEASLTGHLVFSTLHTNSAPETVTRLLDMGLNPLNFSDAFLGVLAQRLVRRICKACKQRISPAKEEFNAIAKEYGLEHFEAMGIRYGDDMDLSTSPGCEKCASSGYRGRMGVHELMEGTKACKSLIKNRAPTEKLFTQAFKDGMTTLKQDAITKAFAGFTDMKEVRRVCID